MNKWFDDIILRGKGGIKKIEKKSILRKNNEAILSKERIKKREKN